MRWIKLAVFQKIINFYHKKIKFFIFWNSVTTRENGKAMVVVGKSFVGVVSQKQKNLVNIHDQKIKNWIFFLNFCRKQN